MDQREGRAVINELRQLIGALSDPEISIDFYEKALQLVMTDDLTGLYNRRYFMMRFQEEIQRGARFNAIFGLLLLDLDDFKSVNDVHGHSRGDQLLCEFSNLLQRELRSVDVISRFGGEEFVVLLPGADTSAAYFTANRLREIVEASKFTDSQLNITVSIGVSSFPEHGRQAGVLLNSVDKALYLAKRQGKNKVCKPSRVDKEIQGEKNLKMRPLHIPGKSFDILPSLPSMRGKKFYRVIPGYSIGSSVPKCFWWGRNGSEFILVLEFLQQTDLPEGDTLYKVLTPEGQRYFIQKNDGIWYYVP